MPDDLDLSEKTKDELYEMATAMDIEGRSSMSREELEKAVKKNAGRPVTSKRISGDPDQGAAQAVVYTDQRTRGGKPIVAPDAPADQTSAGGTVTGPDPAPAPAPTGGAGGAGGGTPPPAPPAP